MNSGLGCERARYQLMAALDGETVAAEPEPPAAAQHLTSCASCYQWWQDLEATNRRFQGVSYPRTDADLWAAVRGRLHQSYAERPRNYRLGLIGALVIAWRALQLFVDLPFPALHPVVPLAAAIAGLWLMARDPLAIQTFAPELEKRGV